MTCCSQWEVTCDVTYRHSSPNSLVKEPEQGHSGGHTHLLPMQVCFTECFTEPKLLSVGHCSLDPIPILSNNCLRLRWQCWELSCSVLLVDLWQTWYIVRSGLPLRSNKVVLPPWQGSILQHFGQPECVVFSSLTSLYCFLARVIHICDTPTVTHDRHPVAARTLACDETHCYTAEEQQSVLIIL